VPEEISRDHSDVDSPLWWRLMILLMEANEVFDPRLELKLARAPESRPFPVEPGDGEHEAAPRIR
jgi:hypothetical protein